MPRAAKNTLSAEEVRRRLDYDPSTGCFRKRETGRIVGYVNSGGYVHVKIDGRPFLAHRLAYVWMMGQWPEHEVDHQNRNRADNRWANLRPANRSQNTHNTASTRSATGAKGVHRSRGRFRAVIMHDGKSLSLGTFATVAEARQAYAGAARRLYGDYAGV